MITLTALGMAQALCAATSDCIVIIDGWNGGSSSRWSQQFPSLDEEQTDALQSDEMVAIRIEEAAVANAVFSRLCRESVDNDTGMIGGAIHLVRPKNGRFAGDRDVDTITFELDAKEMPVIAGGAWSTEVIAERM